MPAGRVLPFRLPRPDEIPRAAGQGRPFDFTGLRFGRLRVLCKSTRTNRHRHGYWLCQCDCGGYALARADGLLRGCHLSCGCHRSEASQQRAAGPRAQNGYFVPAGSDDVDHPGVVPDRAGKRGGDAR